MNKYFLSVQKKKYQERSLNHPTSPTPHICNILQYYTTERRKSAYSAIRLGIFTFSVFKIQTTSEH